MDDVHSGSCPLCANTAPCQIFDDRMAVAINCDHCGIFAISSAAQQRLTGSSLLRAELKNYLRQATCGSCMVRFIHTAADGALIIDCIQAPWQVFPAQ